MQREERSGKAYVIVDFQGSVSCALESSATPSCQFVWSGRPHINPRNNPFSGEKPPSSVTENGNNKSMP